MAINTNHVTNDIAASSGKLTIDGELLSTLVSQTDAETGTSTNIYGWSAERVRQSTKSYVDPLVGDIANALAAINGV